jgi:E3 ubiquitin-protein ligase HERC2
MLTGAGELYTCGKLADGALGHDILDAGSTDAEQFSLVPEPARVAGPLLRVTVAAVAAGSRHTACLSAAGELYTWGTGYNGRLGHSIDDATRADSFPRHLVGHPKVSTALIDYSSNEVQL